MGVGNSWERVARLWPFHGGAMVVAQETAPVFSS